MTAATHPDEFPLIRRHADELARQFGQVLGYRLTVEPGFARLHKAGLGRDSGRRLERGSGAPFTPRTYAYLALALAALVTAPEQLLLSEVVARTRARQPRQGSTSASQIGVTERRAFVAALKQLMAWHVLAEDEGLGRVLRRRRRCGRAAHHRPRDGQAPGERPGEPGRQPRLT